jgi:hydrogenase maturation protein HypF
MDELRPPVLRRDAPLQRLRVVVRGAVQGVGFRPFVYRLAAGLELAGWVQNSTQGVVIEVEGSPPRLRRFLRQLETEKPQRACLQRLEVAFLEPVGHEQFAVRASEEVGAKTALLLPDMATCPECLGEIFDPTNRRYRYPFTNCTNCGPRYSIIEALPYDRAHTTMKAFTMCAPCRAEYENPLDRRFHAQPNACSQCGPHLELWDHRGNRLGSDDDALKAAARAIGSGNIVAVKGLGGFHLLVDARNEAAVRRLRQRKDREEKPFAVMFPNLESVRRHCEVSSLEERLLRSAECPIVLLRHRRGPPCIAAGVAPGNPDLGAILPYTPLHHLLLAELGFPVVATSGNRSDEPICTEEHEARERLRGIADLFLVHNRPIARHVDDSIVRIMLDRPMILRRARGYAPLPISLRQPAPPLLAVGAHLKNTVALALGREVFISQHIGDLETVQAFDALQRVVADLSCCYDLRPAAVACDMHPDYLSTRFAEQSGLPVLHVQHHYAHVLACMVENELDGPVLGVVWDGTGQGLDGTIWGGEFLRVTGNGLDRVAHFRTFRLPGGEKAIREPRRTAIGLLYEVFGDRLSDLDELAPVRTFGEPEIALLLTMLQRQLNAPQTSSAGRLFDAVAALAGLRQVARFEGQAAMELEFAREGMETPEAYPFRIHEAIIDWEPLLRGIVEDVRQRIGAGTISMRFQNALVEIIITVARQVGQERVVLTGGCFQNKYLTEKAVRRLQTEGFRPYWHQRVPPNDGGIALGQIVAASRMQPR